MAKPDELDGAEVAVTMVGDLASALQIASFQRRSSGDDNYEVSGLVQEAVSDWLDKEIYGPSPVPESTDRISQDQEVPNSESDQIAEATTSASRRSIAPILGLGVALLAVIGWSLARSSEPAPPSRPVAPIANGVLIIDARPWAQVERVVNQSGQEMPLPDDRYTPLRLELPPGGYYVSLTRPDSQQTQTCAVPVTASEISQCMPQQAELDINAFFRETGWWQ